MSPYKTIISIIILSLLTVTGSIITKVIFNNELSKDVERERARLESMVFRTYVREYQRINILIQSLQQIQSSDEEENKRSLENILKGYGDNGQIPFIIKNAAYIRNNQLNEVSEQSEGIFLWQQKSDLPEYAVLDRPLKDGQFQIKSIEETSESYLYYNHSDSQNILYIFELNKDAIDKYYANPAVREALPQYILEWKNFDYETYKEIWQNRKDGAYPFKPLQILTGWDHDEEARLMIPLPDGLDSRRPFIPGERPDDIPGFSDEENPDSENEKSLFRFDLDSPPFRFSGKILMIGSEGAPYYSGLEKRTAVNWLMSQIIILGIGLIFLVLILQLKRTTEFRNREKEFVASMTHELRTPLTVIQSAADNLSRGIVSEERVVRYGKMMKDQTIRLSNMVEEILLFSSLEGKDIKNIEPVEMDIIAFLKEMKEYFKPMADEKKVRLHWDYEGIPNRLYAYPAELKLILSNLISNALNHGIGNSGSEQRIKIAVRFLIPGRLKITVEDSGSGIIPSEQKKIFNPFYRSLSSREQQTRGSGLGLFIARKKSRLINGDLRLESPYKKLKGENCKGCRFTLEIPSKVIPEKQEGEY